MTKQLINYILIALGWTFVVIGAIGIVVPVLPTTPFLILALALFSKSSKRFHHMLLTNRWFGPVLSQWEQNKTLARKVKYKSTAIIIVFFSISIYTLRQRPELQVMLIGIGLVSLFFIWKIKEPDE